MKITEYDQLKHGMKVKFKEHNLDIATGKIALHAGDAYFCSNDENYMAFNPFHNDFGFKYDLLFVFGGSNPTIEFIETCEKTLDNLEVGDVLVDEDGCFTKVFGVCEQVVFTTACAEEVEDLIRYHLVYTWSVAEMKQRGFTIYQPEEEIVDGDVIVTLDDIAKLKGVDVSKIKIKK